MNLYLLDWEHTIHGQEPTPEEVTTWLAMQGFVVEGEPKVYKDGTVRVECDPDPTERWPSFAPLHLEDDRAERLATWVREALAARKELLAKPETERTPVERGLLATMALMLAGYGVDDA